MLYSMSAPYKTEHDRSGDHARPSQMDDKRSMEACFGMHPIVTSSRRCSLVADGQCTEEALVTRPFMFGPYNVLNPCDVGNMVYVSASRT